MFNYLILNKPKFEIDENTVKKIFETIGKEINIKQNGCLNIVFVTKEEIKCLNNEYRGINKETDVLSFHYYEDFSKLKREDTAGEIILYEDKILSQGIEYNLGSTKEFYKLLIHSILHILGYDHEKDNDFKIMQKQENLLWSKIFENQE